MPPRIVEEGDPKDLLEWEIDQKTYVHGIGQERAAEATNRLLTHSATPELRNAASGAGNLERGTGIEPA